MEDHDQAGSRTVSTCYAHLVTGYRKCCSEAQLYGSLLDKVKAARDAGSAPDCLMSTYLSQRADKGYEDLPGRGLTEDGWMRDKLLTYTGGSAVEAGSDTTGATIESFLIFMLGEPECLRKAKEEIDRVVGPGRLPTFEDEPELPYFVACLKETLRRRPLGPMGTCSKHGIAWARLSWYHRDATHG